MDAYTKRIATLNAKSSPLIGATMFLQESNSLAMELNEALAKASSEKTEVHDTLNKIMDEFDEGRTDTLAKMTEVRRNISQARTVPQEAASSKPQ